MQLAQPASPAQVVMNVQGFGINRADLLQKQGLYPPPKNCPPVLGLELIGTVSHPDFDSSQLFGCIVPSGGYAQKCTVHRDHLIPLDFPHLSLAEKTCIPEVFLTAFQLIEYADIQGHLSTPLDKDRAPSVYIPAGASGVGTALIQLTRVMFPNARIFATVSTQEKKEKCLSFGADHVVNYKEEGYDALAQSIKETTQGGLDAVFDCLGPGRAKDTLGLLRPEATWVVYAMLTGAEHDNQMMLAGLFRKKIVMVNTMLRSRSDGYKASLTARFREKVVPLIQQKVVSPVLFEQVCVSFDEEGAEKLDDLHSIMESNQNIGKLVVLLEK